LASLLTAQFDVGTLTPPATRRVGFTDLETLLTTHYRNKGRRSLARAERAITHLREAFGAQRAMSISADNILTYETTRLDAGAARATVNYELAILRKMFNLAVKPGKLTTRPAITTTAVENQRTGFFEPDDFAAVLKQLPAALQPVMTFAYLTGWRVRSEVLALTWDRIDFRAGVVRLDRNTNKSGDGRTFPFDALPDLAKLLNAQRDATAALERSLGRIIPHVFHRNGRAIKSYYRAWEKACDRAARGGSTEPLAEVVRPQLVGRIVHDFRRTAVRNLVRAGVPDTIAMKLTGHKTRAVFDRYDITDEADLRSGVAQLAEHLNPKAQRKAKGTKGGQSRLRVVGESS